MKITRLRLLGFKSFVEPVEIPIEPGLTGVVGPNGCGKSNLLEAIRWVMGETSTKSMRASSMEDVIFAGSSERPARNMAEVTLYVDNSARKAPAEFNDYDELEVTRRLEREEGSSYRVNGKEQRARDIRLLFEDAATGARSPALVRQGRIGEIINAKPEERRRVLEDAAGIAGLHSRRHEAELRLKAAEGNLERLHDVTGQLTAQLQSLKRQARQAARYKEVAEKLRETEALRHHLVWQAACAQVEHDEAALTDALKLLGQTTQDEAAAIRAQADLAETLPGFREHEATRAAVLQRLIVERDRLDREEARAKERQAELERRLAQLAQDLAREEALAVEAADTLDRLGRESAALAAQTPADDPRPALLASLATAQADLSAAEARLDETSQRVAEQRLKRQHLAALAADSLHKITSLEAEAARTREALAEIEATAGGAAELERLRAEVEELAKARTAADEKAASADDAERAQRAEESSRREDAATAALRARQLETEVATLSKLLRPSDAGPWRAIVEDVRVAPGYEAALGAALGDELEAPADEAAPAHWWITSSLGDHSLPLGAEPLIDHVDAPPALVRRLAQIGVVAVDRGRALQIELKPGQRLVSRSGDLWRWDGYTATAEAPTPAALRLTERNRLDALTREASIAGAAFAEAERAREAATTATETATAATRSARQSAREAAAALHTDRERLQAAERAALATGRRAAALTEAAGRIETSLRDARQSASATETALAELPDLAAIEGELETERHAAAEARTRFDDTKAALEGVEREARTREDRLRRLGDEEAQWRKRRENAEAQRADMGRRRTQLEAERTAAANLPATIGAQRSRLASELSIAEEARRDAADALAVADTALRAADKAMRASGQRLAEAREGRARSEARLEASRSRRSEQSKAIREGFACAPDGLLAIAKLAPGAAPASLADVDERLIRLRSDRERLGSVNLRAEEEAAVIGAQVDAMEQERHDLTEAIAKLRSGIGSINREGRKRLLDAFEVVNEHFKRLFEVLFNGGAAELKLIESEDPLESGLEIYARPPGKRTQVLTLLSGGEKALTALALIFAVFLTNPSPICVLDEVDAPLDDSNVDRFCLLMDEMAKATDTRFLIITHHPLTMARMHRLFGVTMAERGVSQLVSVDLQTAERYLATG